MESTVFWDATPCTVVDTDGFGGTYCLHLQGRRVHRTSRLLVVCVDGLLFDSEDGASTFLRNIDKHLSDYTA
jgi:hypothetical protein